MKVKLQLIFSIVILPSYMCNHKKERKKEEKERERKREREREREVRKIS
jgi:hypothetical protein